MSENKPIKQKVYIAGKITGEDYQTCYKKFADTAELLTEFGFEPINPMLIVPKGTEWEEAMAICKPHVLNSDIVLFLPDWQDSQGAQLEFHWAKKHGVERAYYHELVGMEKENHAASKH